MLLLVTDNHKAGLYILDRTEKEAVMTMMAMATPIAKTEKSDSRFSFFIK